MSELSLPDFPTRASLNTKLATYQRRAADHRAGKHCTTVKGCKLCREERST